MSLTSTTPRLLRRLRAWYDAPRLNLWVWLSIGILLALHKPWALHTPQLWAEDGSIFLAFNDLHGWHALIEPYMGYLHAVPRLTAAIAGHLLDPRAWPAFYNWTAFVVTCAVIARTFSPRLPLPGKPWLALAFLVGPHTGEILINLTNVQWFLAVLLVEQALLAAPENARERATDYFLTLVCGLTGPFVISFWPLLAWRWLRERTPHNALVLTLATACALVQGVLVLRTGPHFTWPPFNFARLLVVFGQHSLAWPLLGAQLVVHLPHWLIAMAGIAPTFILLVAAARPHPRRSVRLHLVFAFLILIAATQYRARLDSWSPENLVFSDRYFFIPRLLLYWLLILEFDAGWAFGRWAARVAAVLIVLVHLPNYRLRTPHDYHWAEHCDPIRRGVPANIPTLPEGWILEYRGRPGGN